MDERNKRASGITMVALAVTIVVLLILAGVSISTLVGENGVVDNAKKIQNDTYYQIASEEVNQLVLEHKLTKKDETLEEFLTSKVPSRIDGVTRKNDNTLIVKKNGYEIEVEEVKAESQTLTLDVVPYVGTYDGQPHDMLTSVNVLPSDSKVEYSIDNGKTYIENIPQIINASSVSVIVKASRIGYKTETVTKTAVVNKAEGKLKLSETSGTITYPNNTAFTVSENTGTLSVYSNNSNIATASVSGNTVAVKSGTTAGKATITVTSAEASNYTAKSATYEATVNNGTISLSATPYTGTYDGKAHKALTNVSVNPSDAKLEYSINGGTYSTTMPTITNTSSFTVTVRASKAGYKTQSTTQTVKVNKANGSLSLSSYSSTITYPNSTSFTASGTGSISAWSSNTGVATVSVSGNTLTVKSIGVGSATITVKSASNTNYNEKTATYTVTVKDSTVTGNFGVGYYADVDGNGTVDGIIFADFKYGGSGSWGGTDYTISTVTGLKEYYVSKTNYNGPFGIKDVLSARGNGNARFNVMALSDYDNSATYTFPAVERITSGEWRVPTRIELVTFGGQLGITTSNYSGYGLNDRYWSSSGGSSTGYYVNFSNGRIVSASVNLGYPVRLSRTF
jgi:hypothetical protein